MVEADAGTREETVALAIVDRDPVTISLGHRIGTAGIKRGLLGLRRLDRLTEHLAARRLVESNSRVDHANGLEHPRYTERRELPGEDGLLE